MNESITNVSFSMDEITKNLLLQKLQQLGLNLSDFVKLTLSNFANETQQNLNDLTIQTIQNSQNNIDVFYANDVDDLFHQLEN